jgi:uncharacterized protein
MDIHAILTMLTKLLVIIGALNWGLVGLLGLDLVAKLFGTGSVVARVIYILVGLSAVYMLIMARGL